MKQKDALMPGSDVEGMRDGGGWRMKNGGEDRAEPHGQEQRALGKNCSESFQLQVSPRSCLIPPYSHLLQFL